MERIQTIIIIKTKALRAEEGWRKWLNRSTFIFVYYRLHILQTSERMKARHRMRVCHMLSILTCKAFKFIIQILSPFFVRLLSLSVSLSHTPSPLPLTVFILFSLFADWLARFVYQHVYVYFRFVHIVPFRPEHFTNSSLFSIDEDVCARAFMLVFAHFVFRFFFNFFLLIFELHVVAWPIVVNCLKYDWHIFSGGTMRFAVLPLLREMARRHFEIWNLHVWERVKRYEECEYGMEARYPIGIMTTKYVSVVSGCMTLEWATTEGRVWSVLIVQNSLLYFFSVGFSE